MRKFIVLGVSAVVLALGAAQASATCNAAVCGMAPVAAYEGYAAPADEGRVTPTTTFSSRNH